ncbi:MAG: hypothetical protein KJZ62_11460 [Fimbriimonadaceae bacterium]|nr:hypothetical protein [Fimbriimonadaceae bacterium]MCL4285704.1 hypothetical protein [Fimbriimonadaceae bacterium]QOJ12954.1 MAG: hypothetical protein HRU74_13140 [Chthonomonadaceae bacterium]
MSPSAELLALVGSFLATAFGLVRLALSAHRAMTERFVDFLESSLRRQEEVNAHFEAAIEQLTENVRENSTLLGRVAERLNVGGQS